MITGYSFSQNHFLRIIVITITLFYYNNNNNKPKEYNFDLVMDIKLDNDTRLSSLWLVVKVVFYGNL